MPSPYDSKTYHLLDNARFYILLTSCLISLVVIAVLRITIGTDQLFYIRTEQIFGCMALIYWYVALLVSPLGYAIGKRRVMRLAYARRAIGVSAAFFALLHFGFAAWGQLGGISQFAFLPTVFKVSFAMGGTALIILLIMAATSFDKVVTFMTIRRWKLLHRLGYIGFILVVLHIWMIGTHISYGSVQLAAFISLAVLAGLESLRISKTISGRFIELRSKDYQITVFLTIWILWITVIASVPVLVDNYHSLKHSDEHSTSVLEHKK